MLTIRPSWVTLHCKVSSMEDLNKALGDIQNIRRQVARSTEFRGYGPATLTATAAIAIVASGAQTKLVPDPATHIVGYLSVWISAAIVSSALAGAQMYTRSRRIHSQMSNEMIQMAIEQFLPSVVASLLLTAVLLRYVPGALWMLPGIWQLNFSLGVFSSCRFLPRAMLAAGAWYLLTSLVCMSFGDSRALSPWAMAVPFGVGQFLVAGILFFTAHEGRDEE
jgi:hypothetical protein